jgi:diguanylate cyclase (GGDEF)-like protein
VGHTAGDLLLQHIANRLSNQAGPDDVVARFGGDEVGIRNRALILTLLDTGIRAAELHRLELRDLDLSTRRIHVRFGNARKQRILSFGAGPAQVLEAYISEYRSDDQAVRSDLRCSEGC